MEIRQAHEHVALAHLFKAHAHLLVGKLEEDTVFQRAQRKVAFRQEVARAAGRVEHAYAPELFMQLPEGLRTGSTDPRCGASLLELRLQRVHKQRVYDLVDVLRAGEVLAVRAARIVGKRAFEDGAEDGGADDRPVEFVAAVFQQGIAELFTQRRNLGTLAKKAAVHVRKRLEPLPRIGVAGLGRRVQPHEEVFQAAAQVGCLVVVHVVAKGVRRDEAGVLAEHKKHQARHQHGERVVVLGRVGVVEGGRG